MWSGEMTPTGTMCSASTITVPADIAITGLKLRAVSAYHGADACGREHAAQAVAGGADALDQRALRHQLDFERAGQHFLLRLGVEADVARDGLAHHARANQLADAGAGQRIVVGDDRQVALFLAHQLVDQPLGRAHAHEAADHHARPVGD